MDNQIFLLALVLILASLSVATERNELRCHTCSHATCRDSRHIERCSENKTVCLISKFNNENDTETERGRNVTRHCATPEWCRERKFLCHEQPTGVNPKFPVSCQVGCCSTDLCNVSTKGSTANALVMLLLSGIAVFMSMLYH